MSSRTFTHQQFDPAGIPSSIVQLCRPQLSCFRTGSGMSNFLQNSLAARTATSWTAAIPAVVVENSHPSLPDERQAMVPCLLDCIHRAVQILHARFQGVMPWWVHGCPESTPTIAHDIPTNGWFIPQHCKFLQDDQQNRNFVQDFFCSCRKIADQFSDKRIHTTICIATSVQFARDLTLSLGESFQPEVKNRACSRRTGQGFWIWCIKS